MSFMFLSKWTSSTTFKLMFFMERVFMPAPCFPPQYLRFSLTNTEEKLVDEWFKKKENEKSDRGPSVKLHFWSRGH